MGEGRAGECLWEKFEPQLHSPALNLASGALWSASVLSICLLVVIPHHTYQLAGRMVELLNGRLIN